MINTDIYKPDILSNKEGLIRRVLDHKVLKMIRYGLEPKENFLKEYCVDEKMAFLYRRVHWS